MLEFGSMTVFLRLFGEHHVAVLAAQPDRPLALGVDQRHDLLVDRAGQHHLDDLDRLLVGDAQAALELRFDAHLGQHRADLRPAAMHDDRIDAGLLEQRDVAREGLCRARRRPWRGRHISRRRSCSRSAACRAAPCESRAACISAVAAMSVIGDDPLVAAKDRAALSGKGCDGQMTMLHMAAPGSLAPCSGARRARQPEIFSICAASDSSVSSSPGRPTAWMPSGRPSAVTWTGSAIDGWPVTFWIAGQWVNHRLLSISWPKQRLELQQPRQVQPVEHVLDEIVGAVRVHGAAFQRRMRDDRHQHRVVVRRSRR